jgi:hypothetical protein
MSEKKRQATNDAQKQIYDTVLKRLVNNQSAAILPLLFPDLVEEVLEALNIEVLLPPRRTDRAYRTRNYRGKPIVLHLEFEVSANKHMDKRLLAYHALLLEQYHVPVTSIILYPFQVSMVTSPLVESDEEEEILRFRFKTLLLATLDASRFLEQGAVPVYGLLPAMDGTSDEMLLQAIDGMIQYYAENEDLLRDELLCFKVLLQRADRLPEVQIERVLRRIRMFDPLLEEDPWVKEKVAEGEAKGKVKGVRESTELYVQTRFPGLMNLFKERLEQIQDPETLQQVQTAMFAAPNEKHARRYLLALKG